MNWGIYNYLCVIFIEIGYMALTEKQKALCQEIWLKYENDIRSLFISKGIYDPNVIDDLASSVCFALCQSVENGEEILNPQAWLMVVSRNKMNMYFRTLGRTREHIVNESPEDCVLEFTVDVSDELLTDFSIVELREIIQTELTDDEKAIVKYIYFDELTMRQISEITGISESAVKQKHYRLCNKLKKLFIEKQK